MPFEQTKPGQHERPFDDCENFHRIIAATGSNFQQEHYFIVSTIQLRNKPEVDDLKQAWKALRYLHPRIAVVADETGILCRYTVPSSEALDQWLKETFIVHPEDKPSATSTERLNLTLPASPLFTLHWVPASQELLFRASHWRTDGTGMMKLQDAYLSILSSSAKDVIFDGSEVSRIPPTMNDLIAPNFEVTEEATKASQAELQVALNGPEVACLKGALSSAVPRDTARTIRKFSKNETAQIITAVKKRGLKFTAAVQAAFLLTAAHHSTPADGRMLYLNAFDLRKYLAAPWNGTAGASGLYHTARLYSFNLEKGRDYQSISQILSSFYAEGIEHTFSFTPLHIQAIKSMVDVPAEVANAGNMTARAEVSPFGLVDDHLQTRYEGSRYTLEIEDWWLGTQTINKGLPSYVWTRDGQLQITVHYNEAFYKHEFVEHFIEEWRSIIAKEFVHQ